MPPKKERKKLKVIKIPLDYIPEDIPAKFPSMPILYLELLENKQKIKQELRNKDYIPNKYNMDNNTNSSNNKNTTYQDIKFEEDDKKNNDKEKTPSKSKDSVKSKDKKDSKDSKDSKESIPGLLDLSEYEKKINTEEFTDNSYKNLDNEMKRKDDEDRERERRNNDKDYKSYNHSKRSKSHHKNSYKSSYKSSYKDSKHSKDSKNSKNSRDSRHKERRERRERREKRDREYRDKDREHKDRDKDREHKDRDKEHREHKDRDKNKEHKEHKEENNNADKLKELLEVKKDTSNKPPLNDKPTNSTNIPGLPPNLSSIENGDVNSQTFVPGTNGVPLRDMSNISKNEEEESNKKRELLFRFDILRRSYKGAVIPEFSEFSDVATMQKSYDDTVRRLSLDASVDGYRKYLMYGFMATEYVMANWLKIETIKGFTQQQIISMNSYDKLLIELGEKSYLSGESSWPVELRLLFLIIVNAAVFVVSKMIFKSTGSDFINMLNTQTNPSANNPNSQSQTKPKKKMRGPNIDLADLTNEANNDKFKHE